MAMHNRLLLSLSLVLLWALFGRPIDYGLLSWVSVSLPGLSSMIFLIVRISLTIIGGGMEYVIHHLLSVVGLSYAMLTGEGQLYTYMVSISEATTPWINLRWYLDEAGMKNSSVYLTNGIIIFISWLVKQMHTTGVMLLLVVPSALSVMNLIWFGKIFKGLKKTLARRKKSL